MRLVVRTLGGAATRGVVMICGRPLPCAIGRGGLKARKREGDGATPTGAWRLREVLWRQDRVPRPITGLRVRPIRPDDGWCDDAEDRNYNRAIRHPYQASAEKLWRTDHLYDLVVVVDHNRVPRVRGAGSAIFIHLARPGYSSTEGCIALSDRDLRRILRGARSGDRIAIVP